MSLTPRSWRIVPLVISCGVTLPACRVATAQGAVAQLAASAGSATDARGIRSNTLTVSPGFVLFPTAPVTLSLSGSGSRFESSEWQAGVDGGLSARSREWAHGTLTLNALGGYTRTSYHATFSVGEVTPALEMRFGPVTAFGGARMATGRTIVRATAPVGGVPGTGTLTSLTRTTRGPVFGAQWQLIGSGAPLVLGYREEHATLEGAQVVDRSASAELTVGRLSLAANSGRRRSPSESKNFSALSASLAITRVMSLQGSAGEYPSSLLTGAASGRYVSVGLFLRTGAPRPLRLPKPDGVGSVRAGMTRLSIHAPAASRVEVAGDWNDWTPVAASRARNGVWYADLPLAPGEYRYAFRVDGGAWRVPEGAVTSDDGFGGKSAYVTVPRVTASRTAHNQEDK